VAAAYYRDAPDLVLLVIDTERVGPELRYEQVPGQPDPYPHIYGPLNLDAVLETRPFKRQDHDRERLGTNSAQNCSRS